MEPWIKSGDRAPNGRRVSAHSHRHGPPPMVIWVLAFAAASAVALTTFSLADGKISPAERDTVAVAGG